MVLTCCDIFPLIFADDLRRSALILTCICEHPRHFFCDNLQEITAKIRFSLPVIRIKGHFLKNNNLNDS